MGLAEADAFAEGRKIRVTKVPFAASATALIDNDPRGFVKIVTDPATGIVLGGSIVGRNASELISVLALAVTGRLRVVDIVESHVGAPDAGRGPGRSSGVNRRRQGVPPGAPCGELAY